MPDNNSLERRFYSESEERYRSLIQKVRTAIVLHDCQGRILDSNPLAQELLGLSAEQLAGRTLIDPEWHFLREDGSVLPVAEYPASLVLSSRQPLRDYVSGISRPGRDAVTWVLVNAEPECADDGEITQVIVSFVDITDRKRVEDVLYEAQQEFRALIENSPDIIARYDRDCRRTYVNPTYLQVAGLSEQELLATSPAERSPLPAASAELIQKLLRRVLESGVAEFIDIIWPKAGNIDCWFNIYAFPEFDREGRVVSVMTVSRDITVRKHTEDELTRMSERLFLATNAAQIGIWDWDIPKNALSWDDSMYRLYGIQKGDFGGAYEAWARTIHPQDSAHTEGEIQAALRGEREYGPEFRIIRPDGTIRYIKADSQTFRDADGKPLRMIGTNIDITERKQAEAERLAHLKFLESLDRVNRAIQGANNLTQMMGDTLETALSIFDCDRSWLFYPCDPGALSFRVPMEITRPEYPGAGILNEDVPMPPDMALNLRDTLESAGPVMFGVGTDRPINKVSAEQFGVQSMMMVALHPKSGKPWAFGLHQCSSPRLWTAEEQRLFQEISRRLADTLTGLLSHRDLQESEEALKKLNEELEQRVRERTRELERRNHELEEINKAFVGRELRMVELKERIRKLEHDHDQLQADPDKSVSMESGGNK